MENLPEEKIDELVREKMGGKSYSEIRSGLSASGLSEKEVSSIIRQVDEKVLQETAKRGQIASARSWYMAGLILAIAGLILAILFNAGIYFESAPALVVYSPFFAGILLMFYGRMQQRRNYSKQQSKTGPIRKRRPLK
jgi:hypothetical protein